jgi:hypothetical protein
MAATVTPRTRIISKIASGWFGSSLLTTTRRIGISPRSKRLVCQMKFASRTFHPHSCTSDFRNSLRIGALEIACEVAGYYLGNLMCGRRLVRRRNRRPTLCRPPPLIYDCVTFLNVPFVARDAIKGIQIRQPVEPCCSANQLHWPRAFCAARKFRRGRVGVVAIHDMISNQTRRVIAMWCVSITDT